MPTTIYDQVTAKKILPIYSLLFAWDEEVTGLDSVFIEFRLLGDESQVVLDAITRPENGGNRIVGYKATANIFITDATVSDAHLQKILYEKPTRCYVDIRPYSTTDPGYSHAILSLAEYDDATITRIPLTQFSYVAFKQETTRENFKTNIQVSMLFGRNLSTFFTLT